MNKIRSSREICYPPVSATDRQWGLTVTTTGYQAVPPNSEYPTAGHSAAYYFSVGNGRILDEYQLVYIDKGRGMFRSSSVKEVLLEEGSLFMLFPNEWHTYRPDRETGWGTFWIGFKGENMDQLMKGHFFTKASPVIHLGYQEKLIGLFQEALNVARHERPGCQQLLAGLISLMLGIIHYEKRNEDIRNDHMHRLIGKARLMMKEKVWQNISPEQVAGELNMSYSWFRRFFRKYTGVSPGQYLIHLRIRLARELLEQTGLSVKEIAGQLGFESAGYFSVFFKRQTGVGPLDYRKSKQKPVFREKINIQQDID
ncbi:AraC family transcriptional regulator [Gaoshiqia sp. Z1-71]|uniref:AraC family transcriptional regulator n=1 Tax=Gaoshiqia hydrogeniformans TaxID=3290090 RepID=UPI003BF7EDA4